MMPRKHIWKKKKKNLLAGEREKGMELWNGERVGGREREREGKFVMLGQFWLNNKIKHKSVCINSRGN